MIPRIPMDFVDCTREEHGEAILELINHAIVETHMIFDYRPRRIADIEAWFEEKRAKGFPVVGILHNGEFAGFATYGTFRPRHGYKYSVEHSMYLREACCGKGLGRPLLRELVRRAEEQGIHMMIGFIDPRNVSCIKLHLSEGFECAGTIRECAWKAGQWMNLTLLQKILATPLNPDESIPGEQPKSSERHFHEHNRECRNADILRIH
ncbi:MAG: GNAT family N-acetyltransferase [Opitutaceae bacterium]|nr:GNAT family N-acetyltransferase [Opitutaceae bacterium]